MILYVYVYVYDVRVHVDVDVDMHSYGCTVFGLQTDKLAIAVAFVNNYERARATVRRLCAENARFAELARVCNPRYCLLSTLFI